jgi:phage terminase large subunit
MSDIEFPEGLAFLFDPARYKVLYGGRGGAKSWSVARALLIQGAERPLRILCARELQGSILDSVHKLLSDQVGALGLAGFYEVQKTSITGANGTEFIFAGLRNNIASIRSKEGIDRVWVEEANLVSKASWDTLIPTIRQEGSEIWITFNPELDTDVTWQRFVQHPPSSAVVRKIGWQDNPWFPQVLMDEKADLEQRDPDSALVVWEGFTRQVLDGAIYAAEIRAATRDNRITRVPYDASKPVQTFWDLGWADSTSIFFGQVIGFETRVIDYYSNEQQPLEHYQQVLQNRGYVLGTCWLPHDARAKQLGTGRSIEEMLRASGRTVRIVPQLSVEDGINAARTQFANCWFDAERCTDGLNALRRYRYEVDVQSGQRSRKPLHDDSSHGADAFRYLAVALKEKQVRSVPAVKYVPRPGGANSWMGM